MRLRIDMHVHTNNSRDGYTRPDQLDAIIKMRGIDGAAITEHDRLVPLQSESAILVPGIEVTTNGGHVIGVGVSEPVKAGLSPDETIDLIHQQGGLAIIPHPYDPVCQCVRPKTLQVLPDAIETVNADALSFRISRWLAERDAKALKLPMVAGSDSHIPQTIGDAYTEIETASASLEDIMKAIRVGSVLPIGKPTSTLNKLRKLSYKIR